MNFALRAEASVAKKHRQETLAHAPKECLMREGFPLVKPGLRGMLVLLLWLYAPSGALASDTTPATKRPTKVRTSAPARRGFTFEFGLGFGGILVAGLERYGDTKADIGFEPHAISLGGFVTRRLAVVFRWKSTYHFTANTVGVLANRFVGTHTLGLQWWFRERWFLGGGVGVAGFGFGFGTDPKDPAWSLGFGARARVGYAFALFKHHAFKLSYEVVSGFFAQGVAVGQTLNISYQFH